MSRGRRWRWTAAAVAVAAAAAVLLWWGPAKMSMPDALKWFSAVEPLREPVAPARLAAPEPVEAHAADPGGAPDTGAGRDGSRPGHSRRSFAPLPEQVSPPAPVAAPAPAPAAAPAAPQPAEAPPAKAAAEAPSPRSFARTGPPESLGSVTLKRNETISGLIHKVYGDYSNRHFRSIILANPQIDDPDRVEVGQVIRLPALPVSAKPLNKAAWWVTIIDTASLQEAFDMLRNYPESAPPVRLIPFWRPGRRHPVRRGPQAAFHEPANGPAAAEPAAAGIPAGRSAAVVLGRGDRVVRRPVLSDEAVK